ncbi:hypothetical protein ACFL2T_01145 [Elusimicrobiota bacterium]
MANDKPLNEKWTERRAGMKKEAYAKTVDGVISEFDQFATDRDAAEDFVARLSTGWWGVPGVGGAYHDVELGDWNKVMEHISRQYPKIKLPRWSESAAHKSALAGRDPNGKRFDPR